MDARLYHSDARAALVRVYDVNRRRLRSARGAKFATARRRKQRAGLAEGGERRVGLGRRRPRWPGDRVLNQDGTHRQDVPVPLADGHQPVPAATSRRSLTSLPRCARRAAGNSAASSAARGSTLPPGAAAGSESQPDRGASRKSSSSTSSAYGENLDHLEGRLRSCPIPEQAAFQVADAAVRTYAEHLDAWEEMDRLGL